LDSSGTAIIVTGPFITGSIMAVTDGNLNIIVTNIRNPRSTKTTGVFTFQSFDNQNLLIDYYSESNTAVTMTSPSPFL
jgi:hypothetical protein